MKFLERAEDDLRGGIFGKAGEKSLGIFDGKVAEAQAPAIHPEEERVTFTCDAPECEEYRVVINGEPAWASPSWGGWLTAYEKHYCPKHHPLAEGDIEPAAAEEYVPAPWAPLLSEHGSPRERSWPAAILMAMVLVAIIYVMISLYEASK